MTFWICAFSLITSKPSIEIRLENAPRQIKAGDRWIAKLAYVNRSNDDIRLIPLGASAYRSSRAPGSELSIRRVGEKDWFHLVSPGMCGNSNPMAVAEFKLVRPNEKILTEAWFDWKADTVGTEKLKPGS